MKTSTAYEELKTILDNIRTPELLNDHPWTGSLVVRQGVQGDELLSHMAPGYQLISVLSTLFRQLMPSTPPKRGKRLDTRWCQFGILAAEYFAPFLFGAPYPTSLRDAWGRIDQAIPFFVFGKSDDDLPEEQTAQYRLFDGDLEPAPVSTLSDWHTKGLQRLADLFLDHEKLISQKLSQSSPVLHPSGSEVHLRKSERDILNPDLPTRPSSPKSHRRPAIWIRRGGGLILAILFLIVIFLVGDKGMLIYREAKIVYGDLENIQSLLENKPDMATFGQAGPLFSSSRQHLAALRSDVEPFLWMGKYLTWVPVYGGDLSQAEPLLELADELLVCADEAAQGITPLWQEVYAQEQTPKLSALAVLLVDAQPHLSAASAALDAAMSARARLDVEQLSPKVRSLVTEKVDPYLPLLQDGLNLAMALPKLIGASASGPQTYLILFQNEDELRATGGFLTSVGTIVVKDGEVLSSNFEDSYALDDLTKPYPPAPWQLERYMDAYRWLLRDSNWSPDFPTSAALAEYFYAYTRFNSADGVIAVDQHAVQMLLTVLGPINLEGVSYPITSENVIDYIRAAKLVSGGQAFDPSQRKDFIGELGNVILAKISTDQDIPMESLIRVLIQALDEKHILVQLDEPSAASILAERGWDGAVRLTAGDFLMVVDSNIGFTKSNAVMQSEIIYDMDLSNLTFPVSYLKIIQTNSATGNFPCVPMGVLTRSYQDGINLCYWDYQRVYGPSGMQLLDANPHAVPGDEMQDGESVPARVDALDENIAGVDGYGTLFVVPVGVTLETDFQFMLPSSILQTISPQTYLYELRVQKQPGTLANPIHICIHLPDGSTVVVASPEGDFNANTWCLNSDLRTDLTVRLEFSVPSSWTPVQVIRNTATPFPSDVSPDLSNTPQGLPTSTPSNSGFHGLDSPIGTDHQFIIHQVRRGESLDLYAGRYGTTVEAIQAVNYNLPTPLATNYKIVIPVNFSDVSGLPVFEAYRVDQSILVENLARQLSVDQALLEYYNGLSSGELFLAGEWVLVPHERGALP